MKEKSPYSKTSDLDRIDLPENIITYFQQRGRFIRNLPGYEQIEGHMPQIHPRLQEDLLRHKFSTETCPVKNSSYNDNEKAEGESLNLMAVYTKNTVRHLSNLTREYMLTGLTKPIRLRCDLEKKLKLTAYVKKPSVERLFGVILYNLLSGRNSQEYLFNCYSFVEAEIGGRHLNDRNKKQIYALPRFKESVVRLATIDDFLSIHDLDRICEPQGLFSNFIVQKDGEIVAFDFNTLFLPDMRDKKSPLIEVLRERDLDLTKEFERNERRKEMCRIRRVISDNRRSFDNIVKLIDGVPYMRERINDKGYKSAKDYFARKVS